MSAGLPLMKNVLTLFAKSVLIPLGKSAGMSAADAAVQKKKNHGSSRPLGTTALIISNDKMEDTMKVFKFLE